MKTTEVAESTDNFTLVHILIAFKIFLYALILRLEIKTFFTVHVFKTLKGF